MRITLEEKGKTPGPDRAWRRCLPGGCLADEPVKEDGLKRWREAEAPGRLIFKDAGGQEVTIPFSFHRLGRALDALDKKR